MPDAIFLLALMLFIVLPTMGRETNRFAALTWGWTARRPPGRPKAETELEVKADMPSAATAARARIILRDMDISLE